MKTVSPVNNCYRAILAQVNYLDSICDKSTCLKDIYQDLSELAYYLLENDSDRIHRGIEQIKLTVEEIERGNSKGYDPNQSVRLITAEIRTHLQYLRLQYGWEA
ncbi:MAG: hypothetical protein ABRQ26_10980 [Syntrophomonadaceae bacterium]